MIIKTVLLFNESNDSLDDYFRENWIQREELKLREIYY